MQTERARALLFSMLVLVGLTWHPCDASAQAERVQRVPPVEHTQRVQLWCEHWHSDLTIAWVFTTLVPFPLDDVHITDTYLADLDPDPWLGRCRARGEILKGPGPCADGNQDGEWCFGDWSEWKQMDGPPVPLPEPDYLQGIVAGGLLLAALRVWRKRR